MKGKVAIITGAGGGMGEAAAMLFAREGAKVAVVDLAESTAQLVVDQIREAGGQAIAIGADIASAEDVKRIVQRTIDELGLPNVLYNNAGVDLENKKPMIEMAKMALFLASDDSSFATGAAFINDGGWTTIGDAETRP